MGGQHRTMGKLTSKAYSLLPRLDDTFIQVRILAFAGMGLWIIFVPGTILDNIPVLVLIAVFAPAIAPYDPEKVLIGVEQVKKRTKPCIHMLGCPEDQPQHWMGIDGNVRDQFSRVVYGSRVSLFIGFTTIGFSIVMGSLLGSVSGYAGGWVDNVIMRLMDVLMAFPSLLLAIAIVNVLGRGLQNSLLAIG